MLVFYERFIEIKPLEVEIASLEISEEEKNNLHFMIAELLHHHTLETILDQLSEEDKQLFLEAVNQNQEMTIATLLKDKVKNYEKVLKDKLHQVRDDIIEEIRKIKND